MKNILIALIALTPLLGFSQVSQLGSYGLDSVTINSGTKSLYGTTLIASTNPSTPDSISGTAQVNLTATQQVYLLPGFKADGFTGSGNFIGQIGTGPVTNAEIMGSSADGNQYERYEIGLNISKSSPNYITPINNFLAFPQNPGNYTVWSSFHPSIGELNPYDPDQVKIKAVFTNQSSGHQYVRYGYYQQAVASFTSTSYTIATDTTLPFRVRFAPPETGSWKVQLSLYINDTLAPGNSFYSGSFNVNSTTNPGDVGIDPAHTQFFAFQSNPASLYIPIGQSIFWCSWTDPHLYALGEPQKLATRLAEGDANHLAYAWQRQYIRGLANMGGNYMAIGTVPWSYGLEWGSQLANITSINHTASVICDYRQDAAYELDSTLALCENKGIYMQLSFVKDGYSYFAGESYQWYNSTDQLYSSPYYFLLGGTTSDAEPKVDLIHFFDSSLAQKYFKKELFYIEARWGYSPNIAVWNLANEADQLGLDDSIGTEYTTNLPATGLGFTPDSANSFQKALSKWTDTMSTYLHSFYPPHLTSISHARPSAPFGYNLSSPDYVPGSDVSPNYVDVLDAHDYNSSFNENTASERRNRAINSYGSVGLTKPFLFGEMGNNISCPSKVTFIDYLEDISFHNSEWATPFMSSGAGLYFYDFEESVIISGSYVANPIKHRKNFTALSTFFNNPTILSALEQGGWSDTLEYYNSNNVNYFLRVNPYNAQIGWLQNATVSWENVSFGSCYTAVSPSALSTTLEFNGLTWGSTYYVKMYNTYTGDSITTISGVASMGTFTVSTWRFASSADTTYPISNTTVQPDYAFLLTSSTFHKPQRNDSTVIVLPNDTVYLPMDSIHFIGSIDTQHKSYTFHWDFGNGITSNVQPFPNFIYHNIGNYTANVRFADSVGNDKTIIYQTYVVLDSAIKAQLLKKVTASTVLDSATQKQLVANEDNSRIILAPNPTSNSFAVYINNGQHIENIEISDVFGRKCFSEYSPQSNIFNVSSFSAGIYIVKILSNRVVTTQKLVIQR